MSVLRAKYVVRKSINYDVTLGLKEGKNFYGEVLTTFSLRLDEDGKRSDLFFDCEIANIQKIELNGYSYTALELRDMVKDKFILLPKELLRWGLE